MHMTCAYMCGMHLDAGAGESVGALGAGATARDRPWCWLGVCSAAAAGSHSGAAPVALPHSTMLLNKRSSGRFVGAGAAARDRPWSWLSFCPAPAACRHPGAAAAAAPCRPACSVSGAILCRMDLVQHAACRRCLCLHSSSRSNLGAILCWVCVRCCRKPADMRSCTCAFPGVAFAAGGMSCQDRAVLVYKPAEAGQQVNFQETQMMS